MGAPAARASELAHHWSVAGHDVSVLTGFPNHPTGVVPDQWRPRLRRLVYREQVDGVTVYRTWLWPLPNRKAHERMRTTRRSVFRPPSAASHFLVLMSSSRRRLSCSSTFRLVDFFHPAGAAGLRGSRSLARISGSGRCRPRNSLLYTALSKVARFLYERSALIVVVTSAFKEHLIRRWRVPAQKIAVIENGVETELFKPLPSTATDALRRDLGVESKSLVCYVGTMGMAHGLETILDAAAILRRQEPDVLFLLVGEGAEKQRIKALAESRRYLT